MPQVSLARVSRTENSLEYRNRDRPVAPKPKADGDEKTGFHGYLQGLERRAEGYSHAPPDRKEVTDSSVVAQAHGGPPPGAADVRRVGVLKEERCTVRGAPSQPARCPGDLPWARAQFPIRRCHLARDSRRPPHAHRTPQSCGWPSGVHDSDRGCPWCRTLLRPPWSP